MSLIKKRGENDYSNRASLSEIEFFALQMNRQNNDRMENLPFARE